MLKGYPALLHIALLSSITQPKDDFMYGKEFFDSPDIILDVETQLLNAAFQVKQNLQPTLILTLLMKIILPCN